MWEDKLSGLNAEALRGLTRGLKPWYYGLTLIPLLTGGFLAAAGEDFRFAPFLFLLLTTVFFKLAFSAWYGSRESELPPRASSFFFVPSSLAHGDELLARALLFGGVVLTVICGFVLCLISGWGMLAFYVLTVLGYLAVAMGLDRRLPGVTVALVFLAEGVIPAVASYYSQCGFANSAALTAALPLAFVFAGLHFADEREHTARDRRQNLQTLALKAGEPTGERLLLAALIGAYAFVLLNFLYSVTGFWPLLLFFIIIYLAREGYKTEKQYLRFALIFGFGYALMMLLRFAF